MDMELITKDTYTFDNILDRPDKPTITEIANIISPKPQTVVNENNVVFGYVNTSDLTKFWADSSYTLEIECADGFVYLARNNNKSYRWNGTTLVRLDDETIPAHTYSTTEQRLNEKWIDGKWIYERTYNCGALPSKTTKNVALNITNLDKVIHLEGIAIDASNGHFWELPYVDSTSVGAGIMLRIASNKIYFNTGITDRSSFTAYVTVQYTKTS